MFKLFVRDNVAQLKESPLFHVRATTAHALND